MQLQELQTFAGQHGIKLFNESSAKNNTGINDMFLKLANELHQNRDKIKEMNNTKAGFNLGKGAHDN